MVIADLFNSAQSVIQNDDATNKQILVKGNITADVPYNSGMAVAKGHLDFTLTVQCKDGRYKFSIKPQNHYAKNMQYNFDGGYFGNEKRVNRNMRQSEWDNVRGKADEKFKSLISSLKQKMNENSQKEDW